MDCKRSRLATRCMASLALLTLGWSMSLSAGAQMASSTPRFVSINLCTDQYLLTLAPPSSIAGVSPLARTELSYMATRAAGFPAMSGGAEDVLLLRPSLVLAGAFSGAETRAMLARHGVKIETFATVTTLAEARNEILRAASLLANPAGGEALLNEIDRAMTNARDVGRGLTAIAYERRGFASGRGTLIDELMTHLGLTNAATRAGISSVGPMSLEAVVEARPDLLILDWSGGKPPDQGAALLLHPVLTRAVPPAHHVVLPAALVSCAGPALPATIDTLAAQIRRVTNERKK